jgi:hypothetical protein
MGGFPVRSQWCSHCDTTHYAGSLPILKRSRTDVRDVRKTLNIFRKSGTASDTTNDENPGALGFTITIPTNATERHAAVAQIGKHELPARFGNNDTTRRTQFGHADSSVGHAEQFSRYHLRPAQLLGSIETAQLPLTNANTVVRKIC